MLSKHAALEILGCRPSDAPALDRWTQAVETGISGHALRPAAQWLDCSLRLEKEPDAAIAEWSALAEAEAASVGRDPRGASALLATTLFYCLAEAEANAGRQSQADQTAARARTLVSGMDDTMAAYVHTQVVKTLQHRGLFRWAENEWRAVIESVSPEYQAYGHIMLAEMKYDLGDDRAAADVLDELLQMDRRRLQIALVSFGQSMARTQARRNFFRACHCKQQGDDKSQREYLDLAIAADPTEVDALIACFHLTDVDAAYHEKIVTLIGKAADRIRRDIKGESDDPSHYNELAWLLGNTDDPNDEALKSAQKAIEMSPESGAYYDTLAHVYFGRGDFENAVIYQTKAVALEPHSGLINKKLAVFRQKLEERKIKTTP